MGIPIGMPMPMPGNPSIGEPNDMCAARFAGGSCPPTIEDAPPPTWLPESHPPVLSALAWYAAWAIICIICCER